MRNYKRKSDRGTKLFIKRMKNDPVNLRFGYGSPRQIFNKEQEASLTEYLRKLAQIFHGIGPKEVRRMAYDCAIKYKICVPSTWHTNKMAGRDWMSVFLKRNTSLSIRKPEATSLSRATSFNKSNVQEFYTKLADVVDRFKFTASSIWNADETGVSTVTKPSKIVAAKGKRNVGSITSDERGTNTSFSQPRTRTPPPLYIQDKTEWNNISRLMADKNIHFFHARSTAQGIRVIVQDSTTHRCLTTLLRDSKISFHTHAVEDERQLRLVFRGLPKEIDNKSIFDDLQRQKFPIREVNRMYHPKTKAPYNMVLFILDLSSEDSNRRLAAALCSRCTG
ncbi:unnamed protein product [Euphydryas editha]|uniref:HTH CENPB-type domain-containing protein n=1 Tax=Euphydryas editha TaxID=104508 RepID=A0AAU9USI1_EUPED|nr:unnamed protein product [Euphydryas editha]